MVVLFHLIYIHHACSCILCKLSSSLPYLSLPLLPSSTLKGNLLIYNKYDKYNFIPILNSKEFNYDNGDDSHTSSSLSSLSSMLSYLSHDNQRRSVINFDHINNNNNYYYYDSNVIHDGNITTRKINNNSYYMNDARNDDNDDSDNKTVSYMVEIKIINNLLTNMKYLNYN